MKPRFTDTLQTRLANIILALFALLGLALIAFEYAEYRKDVHSIRTRYLESQKKLVKTQVQRSLQFIKYQQRIAYKNIQKELQREVNMAHDLAMHIYTQYRASLSDAETAALIRETLRGLRFNDGRGYFFATWMNGTELLFADRPEFEGKDMRGLQDADGRYVVQEMIALMKEKDSAYYQYRWSKPGNSDLNNSKIAYIRLFKPLGFFIGTGEYPDNRTPSIQQAIMSRQRTIRYDNGDGYMFIVDTNGTIIMHGAQPELEGSTLKESQREAISTILKAATPEGTFVTYRWNRPETGQQAPKISFVVKIPEWNWVVGSGLYYDEIEATVQDKTRILMIKTTAVISVVVLLAITMIILRTRISSRIMKEITEDITRFTGKLFRDTAENEELQNDYLFQEFEELDSQYREIISERIKARKATQYSEAKFQSFVQSSYEGIIIINDAGRILEWNRGASLITGIPQSDALGHSFMETMRSILPKTENGRNDFNETISQVLKIPALHSSNELYFNEFTILRSDGTCHILHITAFSFAMGDSGNAGIILRDISEQKDHENKLTEARVIAEEANRAKVRFLATMSHEIRTPLNAILGMTELALSNELDSETTGYLETVQYASQHLRSIIEDVLDFSRIEAGKLQLRKRDFDLHLLLNRIKEIFTLQASQSDIEFQLFTSDDLPQHVHGDPERLQQILINLVNNAFKFTPKGHVHLHSRSADLDADHCEILFSVEDTGIGIPEKEREAIFEHFHQSNTSLTRPYSGTGLGLTISRELVRLMDGSIWVEPNSHSGSTFNFTVSMAVAQGIDEKDRDPASDTCNESDEARSLSILIAEDNNVNAHLARVALEKLGHRITIAGDGERALELLSAQSFDLIFMDIEMPNLDGISATRKIRSGAAGQENRSIPVIAMTAHAMHDILDKCLEAGMNETITKPIDIHTLPAIICRTMRQE